MRIRPFRPAALALLALAGACSPSEDRVERALEQELQRLVGPADHYDVDVEGLRARSGEADRVVGVGVGVRPPGAPALDRITVEMTDVRYDRERRRLVRLGGATATAIITPADLARFLEREGGVRDADVRLVEPDSAFLRLRPDLGGFPLPRGAFAEVTGRLRGVGSHIRFEVEEVRAAGLGLGSRATETLSGLINPLVDLSEMPVAFEVTDVRVEGGLLRVDAVAAAMSVAR